MDTKQSTSAPIKHKAPNNFLFVPIIETQWCSEIVSYNALHLQLCTKLFVWICVCDLLNQLYVCENVLLCHKLQYPFLFPQCSVWRWLLRGSSSAAWCPVDASGGRRRSSQCWIIPTVACSRSLRRSLASSAR